MDGRSTYERCNLTPTEPTDRERDSLVQRLLACHCHSFVVCLLLQALLLLLLARQINCS